MSEFEHLELPRKTDFALPRRSNPGFGARSSRSNRGSHGRKLQEQAGRLVQRSRRKTSPFRINPKLIFKLKLRQKGYLSEDNLSAMDFTLLAQEPSQKQAIIVFSDDEELTKFQQRLGTYRSDSGYEYGELDDIEDLVALEPSDRLGRLLELEPLQEDELAALDLELWHTGDMSEMRQKLEDLDAFLKGIVDSSPMRVSDRYVSEYLCFARVKVTREILELLLEDDAVKEIDRRPQPSFEVSQRYRVTLDDFPEVVSPPEANCGVLVIDSGVQGGHPFIGAALGEAAVFPDRDLSLVRGGPEDGDTGTPGHGTGVAGLAIYGCVSTCIREGSFQPDTWLFSARVTDENNRYDPDVLIETQLKRAIEYFINEYSNCKVINFSLGDDRLLFREGQKQFPLAAFFDELAYEYQHKNLVFVISAGNFCYVADSNEQILQDYPHYLLSEEAQIIEPATAAIPLTVGSLSEGLGSSQYPNDAAETSIAKVVGYPSPFTRTGFGVDRMIKPDLCEFGGDFVLRRSRILPNEPGVAVLTLAKDFGPSLFRAFCGTSFAAPKVANIAARLFTQYPGASSNLIRALIANSATHPKEIPQALQGDRAEAENKRLRIYGYGQPNFERAQYSAENRVVLLEDNVQIQVGKFHMYEIPSLPEEFLTTSGTRILSVALAFDPPTRPTRGDSYLGVTMEFHLFKKINPEAVFNAFIKASDSDSPENYTEISLEELKKEYGTKVRLKLWPGVSQLKKGTLQKGFFKTKSAAAFDDKPLYLVVCCNRKWAKPEEVDMQRYALVVSLSHSNTEVNIYNQMRIKTRVAPRLRVRS